MGHLIQHIKDILKFQLKQKKKYKINKIIWTITKKNPFKSKSYFELKKRIDFAKKITKQHSFISVKYYEDKLKSLKSTAFRKLNTKGLQFIKFKKVNISSSKLRKI